MGRKRPWRSWSRSTMSMHQALSAPSAMRRGAEGSAIAMPGMAERPWWAIIIVIIMTGNDLSSSSTALSLWIRERPAVVSLWARTTRFKSGRCGYHCPCAICSWKKAAPRVCAFQRAQVGNHETDTQTIARPACFPQKGSISMFLQLEKLAKIHCQKRRSPRSKNQRRMLTLLAWLAVDRDRTLSLPMIPSPVW